jgi:hypothetical protein
MRARTIGLSLVLVLVMSTPASAANPPKFCGSHTYSSGQFLVFASKGVLCRFATRHARAVAVRHRCAGGWRYSLRKPNKYGICRRGARFYFAQPLK